MKKSTQIILNKTILKLGKEGEIVKVAPGYAFNYLIPNTIATLVSIGKLKHAKMLNEIQNQRAEIIRIKAKQLQEKLENIAKISVKKKIGDKQWIFGHINDKEIVEEILKFTGIKLDKKQIQIPEIKTAGIYPIRIQILDNISVNMKLQVLPINI
uniref:ribosomal protein L9 n=1 Tax=Polyopes affinis TaxID=194519 RepID=UPI002A7EED0B|nr:ribosomal protein L9 [Polyopes affinis]WOL37026.1 ribosomal protein L9 [Polyopes affinis]